MLNARQLDLAVLFDSRIHASQNLQRRATLERDCRCWRKTCSSSPAQCRTARPRRGAAAWRMTQLREDAADPAHRAPHGLRSTLGRRLRARQGITSGAWRLEIDSLAMLMEAVGAGSGRHPAALGRGGALSPTRRHTLSHGSASTDAGATRENCALQPVGRRALAGRAGRARGAGRLCACAGEGRRLDGCPRIAPPGLKG
jgi:hypothetical protein